MSDHSSDGDCSDVSELSPRSQDFLSDDDSERSVDTHVEQLDMLLETMTKEGGAIPSMFVEAQPYVQKLLEEAHDSINDIEGVYVDEDEDEKNKTIDAQKKEMMDLEVHVCQLRHLRDKIKNALDKEIKEKTPTTFHRWANEFIERVKEDIIEVMSLQ